MMTTSTSWSPTSGGQSGGVADVAAQTELAMLGSSFRIISQSSKPKD
jgi:hypothetical protein